MRTRCGGRRRRRFLDRHRLHGLASFGSCGKAIACALHGALTGRWTLRTSRDSCTTRRGAGQRTACPTTTGRRSFPSYAIGSTPRRGSDRSWSCATNRTAPEGPSAVEARSFPARFRRDPRSGRPRCSVTFMGLRHGGLTEGADVGLSDAQMRALSGHRTAAALLRYSQATSRQRKVGARLRRDGTKRDNLSE